MARNTLVYAQVTPRGDDHARPQKPKSAVIDLDADEDRATHDGPVTAGAMTEEAATAKRLFDSEDWTAAAPAQFRVHAGETGDDEGNRQIAKYHLAISLFRLQLFAASYGHFSDIADNPSHLKFHETLLWLSKLATYLPDSADVVERVGKYSPADLSRFDNPLQRDSFWHLSYLLGRYYYRNRRYDDAVRLLERVDPASPVYPQSQIIAGMSHVLLRKSDPAVRAFRRVAEMPEGAADSATNRQARERMRNLAHLMLARTYYGAAIRLDEDGEVHVRDAHLTAAVRHWSKVDVASEYWLDSRHERAWAFWLAGDLGAVVAQTQAVQWHLSDMVLVPEAEIVQAIAYFRNCQYEEATTVLVRLRRRLDAARGALKTVLSGFAGADRAEKFYAFLRDVRTGDADVPLVCLSALQRALSSPVVLRGTEYLRVLESERKRLATLPRSPLRADIEDRLRLTRDVTLRSAGDAGFRSVERDIDELTETLHEAETALIDIVAANRNSLAQGMTGPTGPVRHHADCTEKLPWTGGRFESPASAITPGHLLED